MSVALEDFHLRISFQSADGSVGSEDTLILGWNVWSSGRQTAKRSS